MKHISEILSQLGHLKPGTEEECGYLAMRLKSGAMHCNKCGYTTDDDPGLPLGWESVEIVEP